MDPQYRCDNENRRRLVLDHPTHNGVDYLEVLDQGAPPGLPRQRFLLVHFLKEAPTLTEANVEIECEPRVAAVGVVWAQRAADMTTALVADPASGATLTTAQRDFFHGLDDAANTLVVLTDGTGDYSTYTLRFVTSPTDDAPPGNLDQRLASVAFSFKVECPSDFDCAPEDPCPPDVFDEPAIDYLAKDYASFRRLMLDRLSTLVPDWRDRSPADLQIALVELLAYAGDYLSYYQDAVATEAYLGTARRRVSVRRHARLLDYAMHDGCNARAWVHLDVDAGAVTLPAGTPLRTDDSDDAFVFETMHEARLHSANNTIGIYTWGDSECCLPAGATRATLCNDTRCVDPEANPDTLGLALAVGDVLVLEEIVSPTTGLAADADRARRHAVRLTYVEPSKDDLPDPPVAVVEVAWHEADALPFTLCLSTVLDGTEVADISVARGNVVLADEGGTVTAEPLEPAAVPADGRYRPRLGRDSVAFAVTYNHEEAVEQPAALALAQAPRAALPVVTLDGDDETWEPRRDLLASDRFATEFVAEVEEGGETTFRFGDDVLGTAPSAGSLFTATYRVGHGPAGNVGAEAISIADAASISGVRNPLPAEGGTAPESAEEVRQYAPQAFRTQERAVTAADYAEVTARHDAVQKAAATFRWTGSWTTVFVTVDRKGGLPVRDDVRFLDEIRAHIERYRLAGYDLEINDPVFVPLDLALNICVAPGYFRSDVQRSLRDVFGRFERAGRQRGFFHPDNFTFGQPVYLSQIYRTAMDVEGVASVEVRRFQRWGEDDNGEREAGVLRTASLEIVRLDNDPSRPGNGRLELDMLGGL